MDQTVSRRSEPSSRTAFMGEQPNPWDVLPPQVAMSRHRGAKPSRRCELLGKISLFNFVITKTFKSLFLRVSKEFRLCHQLCFITSCRALVERLLVAHPHSLVVERFYLLPFEIES